MLRRPEGLQEVRPGQRLPVWLEGGLQVVEVYPTDPRPFWRRWRWAVVGLVLAGLLELGAFLVLGLALWRAACLP